MEEDSRHLEGNPDGKGQVGGTEEVPRTQEMQAARRHPHPESIQRHPVTRRPDG